jgi:hypothetical protein
MKRGGEEVASGDVVSSFPYNDGTGKCIVEKLDGPRPFGVYLVRQNGTPELLETHKTQANAESVARWIALDFLGVTR